MIDRSVELRPGALTRIYILPSALIALGLASTFGCGHARQSVPAAKTRSTLSTPTSGLREDEGGQSAKYVRAPVRVTREPLTQQPARPEPRTVGKPAESKDKTEVAKRMGGVAEGARAQASAAPRSVDDLLLASPSMGIIGGLGTASGHGAAGITRSRFGGSGMVRAPYIAQGYGKGGALHQMRANGPAAVIAAAPGDFNTEGYAHHADNPFQLVSDSPLSTFSIDVDTASYSNVRRFLRDGQRPPIDAVRIEELVNYFRYGYVAPRGDAPVSVSTEVASAPWSARHRLVQIGLRARDIASAAVPARNLVFLIDVSGSMESPDKLPLLKQGLALLARQLRPQDRIAMVVYAGASGLALPSTPGNEQGAILSALGSLEAGGSTNGAGGIELAYRVAQQHFVQGGINRVILATDGDFNVGVTSEGELTRLIEDKRKTGVFLTVLGFGTGNLKDSTMEALADKGNGHYAYIDSIAEARKVLVRESGSTLQTVAKDVKLQIEWNPRRVASYRLIGYENRVLAERDFNDDKKDAGDMGAGHTVTALYEIELSNGETGGSEVDPLKYQAGRAPTAAAESDELLTVKLRYKRPASEQSALLSTTVKDRGQTLEQSSADFRWAAAVAGFGMLLRASEARGELSLDLVQKLARSAVGEDRTGDRKELLELLQRAARLGVGG